MLQEVAMVKGKRSKRPRSASPLALTIASTSSTSAVISDASPSHSSGIALAHDEEEEDMANCLILLAEGRLSSQPPPQPPASTEVYQCKTCSKCFPSFQALGGHRASHKKPNKPTSLEEKKPLSDEDTNLSLQISNRPASSGSPRVHECSICGAEFGSGQALGGHMRRHRPIPGVKKARNLLSLDLNLPAPEDDQPESKFPFSAKEQVIVFAASPLIDCHY
ncbi:zinc finger protein ZAT5-like [Salvia hispanica]|uniref:zinc finger protein ZAT5-like n=1 Tax=Salvia hispanica TaxID=49212 RepID=UPI0020097BB0|nr:zinc finger protein ZAT5-like [Salvia hispanica]